MSTLHAARSAGAQAEPGGRAHPSVGTYLRVATLLAVLTILEVWVYTVDALRPIVAPILLALAGAKFVLVVAFYMHLRFDDRLFSYVFGFGLFIAAAIVTAMLFMFGQYPLPLPAAGSRP